MPEGDTIWRTAAAMRPRLVGKTITEARPAMLARLRGHRLTEVEPRGKHLFMRFDNDLILHSHMRMTGAWHIYSPGQPWRRPARLAKAVLTFPDTVAVLFSAPVVELLREPAQVVGHLGPDILEEPFEIGEVLRRVAASGAPTLGELLLDQRVCAGIGNIYKCESLWRLRLDPWLSPASLDITVVEQVYSTARELMRSSALGGGPRQRRAVHGRGGRPCPRCHRPVRVRVQGEQGRLTYFCPACQGVPTGP
jgi:endonuclease-8